MQSVFVTVISVPSTTHERLFAATFHHINSPPPPTQIVSRRVFETYIVLLKLTSFIPRPTKYLLRHDSASRCAARVCDEYGAVEE